MRCPNCGADNPAFHAFCYQCGNKVAQHSSNTEGEFSAPRTQDLQPELKKVTILFVDITNSVQLIHKLKAEDSADYLDPTISSLKQNAHRYGGMINRVDGDGMMVIFGAPVAYEDHAVRACYAALDMLKSVKGEFERTGIAVRIGIHSGEVLMKPFYNDFSVDYEALGPTVYLAHRMEVLAHPNTAVISKDTYNAAQKQIRVDDLGPVQVKGLDEPVELYQIQGRVRQDEGNESKLGDTPFVGRDNEIKLIQQNLAETREHFGRCVAICAEPGVGKSRLVTRVLQGINPTQYHVLTTACDSHNRSTAYLPFSNIIRCWLNVQDSDSQLDIAQKLRDRIANLNESFAEHLSAYHFLLDLPIQNQSWNSLEPVQKRQRARKAMRALLDELARQKPLVILLEDLHWIDGESQTLLEQLVKSVHDHNSLLIVTYRPEYQASWLNENVSLLELKPFTDLESNDYLKGVLGKDPSLITLRDEISRRCEGNPLYIEEMIHHLMDSNLIWGEPGSYTSGLNSLPDTLPLTIHSVISTRIDRRSKLAKNILQAASAIGQRFSTGLLDYITDIPRDYAKHAIDELVQCGLVIKASDGLNDEFQFKHALVHQVTYDSIPRERKRLIHASLVNAIESLHKERLEEHVYRLAEHAYMGQYWHKAVEYYLKACYHAIGRSSHHQAVLLLDRGLEALRHLPLNKDTLGQRIDFLAVGMNALIPLGEQDRLVRDLKEAEKLCDAVGEPKRTCSILCQLTNALWMVGKHQEAFTASSRAVELANEIQHVPLQIAASYNHAMVYHAMGEFDSCIRLEQGILRILTGDMEVSRLGWTGYPSVFCRTFYGNSLVELGRLADAESVIQRAVEIAEGAQHPYSKAMIYDTYGYYLLAVGNYQSARSILDTALTICDEFAIHTMVPAVSAKLGQALVGSGELQLAEKVLEQAVQPSCYRKGGRYTWFYLFQAMAELQLALNNIDKAHLYARKSFTVTSETNEKAHHGWACLTLAKVHNAMDQQRQADKLIDLALDIAKQKNMALLGYQAAVYNAEELQRREDHDASLVYLELAHDFAQITGHRPFLDKLHYLKDRIA
ncbi:MAG: AAA family ATPase [Pseudomonadota bacterium]|nr:AAA family ATPase [Pseudomonadota bacterium]